MNDDFSELDIRPLFLVSENTGEKRLEIVGYVPPLSLQAKSSRKRPYMEALRRAVKQASTLVFLGDVKVTIEWYAEQRQRYSSNKVADIDNIVKPILDSISGEGGILIDDGQVQAIDVRWLDKNNVEEDFHVVVESLPSNVTYKRSGLRFAQFTPSHCFPIAGELPPSAVTTMLVHVNEVLENGKLLRELEIHPHYAEMHFPIQRFFPSSRLKANGYEPIPWEDMIANG